jgi:hypothetical protein
MSGDPSGSAFRQLSEEVVRAIEKRNTGQPPTKKVEITSK